MDNMYEFEIVQDYIWIECMGSIFKFLLEEVLVEYFIKYVDCIKLVSEYVFFLVVNLIDISLQFFIVYGGYSDFIKFMVFGILFFLFMVIIFIFIIIWMVIFFISSDVFYLFRVNYVFQIYVSWLVSRIGEVYFMLFILWSDVDIVYDKDINIIGIIIYFFV